MFTRTFLKHTILAGAICAVLGLLTPSLFSAAPPANDLAPYRALATEALQLVTAGKMKEAVKKGEEIEEKWDANGLEGPYPQIDDQMDAMNNALKSGDAKKATAEIKKYLSLIDKATK